MLLKMGRILLLVVFLVSLGASSSMYENCSTKLSVLEQALYDTGQNEQELNLAFFPSRQITSRYIPIIYVFLPEDEYCNVTFFWSVGGFLLIQPPTIFRFTSLHFSYPVNDVVSITIHLPSECRPLVTDSSGGCSCKSNKTTILDILSQQVRLLYCTNIIVNGERVNSKYNSHVG